MLREQRHQRTAVPEEYEILDTHALAERLGFKRDTILTYITRQSWHRIPPPDRHLATGPLWYEQTVREWEHRNRKRYGKPQANGRTRNTRT